MKIANHLNNFKIFFISYKNTCFNKVTLFITNQVNLQLIVLSILIMIIYFNFM